MNTGLDQANITSFLDKSLVNLASERPYTAEADVITPGLVGDLLAEAGSLPRLLFRDGPEWVNTTRATFFPKGARDTPPVISSLLRSEAWVPNCQRIASVIATSVNLLGVTTQTSNTPLTPLSNWQPNRIGFNFTEGRDGEPGYIPAHIDPARLSGLVAVIELIGERPGTMKAIYAADVCRILGISQPKHSVPKTTSTRMSMTIGMLLKNDPTS